MKRVTIFGGSFNPINNGHIALARSVLANDMADEVWLMVSPQNPLKEQQDLMPERFRLQLAELAVINEPHIVVSDFEFKLPRPSFTSNTLKALRHQYAGTDFSLLIGGDNWRVFHKWADYEELLRNHTIIIYPRPNYAIEKENLPSNVLMLKDVPLYPWSSTEIRRHLHCGEDISTAVPPIVADVLKQEYHVFKKHLPT